MAPFGEPSPPPTRWQVVALVVLLVFTIVAVVTQPDHRREPRIVTDGVWVIDLDCPFGAGEVIQRGRHVEWTCRPSPAAGTDELLVVDTSPDGQVGR